MCRVVSYDQDQPKRFKQRITTGIAKERRWEDEVEFVRKDGSVGHADVRYVPVLDEEGTPFALVGVTREVNPSKASPPQTPDVPSPGVAEPPSTGDDTQDVGEMVETTELLADLLDRQVDRLADSSVRNAAIANHGRTEALALLQKQAAATGGSNVDFEKFVRKIVQALLERVGPEETAVEVHLSVKNVILPMQVACPLGLALNELLSNSMIHAFGRRETGDRKSVV